MKKTFLIILVLTISILIQPLELVASVNQIEINIVAEKNVNIGKNTFIDLKWDKGFQAINLKVKYDSSKLEYISSTIENTFINCSNKGEIEIAWFSSNNQDLTNVKFEFKTIAIGNTNVIVEDNGGCATGDLTVYNVKRANHSMNIEEKQTKPDVKPIQKPDVKPIQKPDVKPSQKPENKKPIKQEISSANKKPTNNKNNSNSNNIIGKIEPVIPTNNEVIESNQNKIDSNEKNEETSNNLDREDINDTVFNENTETNKNENNNTKHNFIIILICLILLVLIIGYILYNNRKNRNNRR